MQCNEESKVIFIRYSLYMHTKCILIILLTAFNVLQGWDTLFRAVD